MNVCHQRTRISDCPTVMGHFGKSWIKNNVVIGALKFCFYFFRLAKESLKKGMRERSERSEGCVEILPGSSAMWAGCHVLTLKKM